MAEERIRAGLAASGDDAVAAARELVRSGGEPDPERLPGTLASALAIGFATGPADSARRRRLAEVAGADRQTVAASCAVAAMAAYAATGAPLFSVFAAGVEEAGAVDSGARGPLTQAAVGRWQAPPDAAGPLVTVAHAVTVLCGDGGSADPLAGALTAARSGDAVAARDDELTKLAAGLFRLRG